MRRTGTARALIAGGCLVCWSALALGQATSTSTRPDDGKELRRRLRRLRAEVGEIPVTSPSSGRPQRSPAPPPNEEGRPVLERRCRLAYDEASEWYVLTFADEPNRPELPPLRVLPCRRLEAMEKILAERSKAEFRVTGEIIMQGSKRYILPTDFRLVLPRRPPPTSSTTQPATGTPDNQDVPVDPQDVLDRMFQGEREVPVVVPDSPATRPAEEAEPPGPYRSKGVIADRAAQIVPEPGTKWYQARFVADNTLAEPPMRVLPSRLRGIAESQGRKVYRISALVTEYKGRKYLLLRKLVAEPDMGQF